MDIDHYIRLVPSEHFNRPNFTEWLSVALRLGINCDELLDSFGRAFSIDNTVVRAVTTFLSEHMVSSGYESVGTAVGAQLDIIGEYVGVSRRLDFQPADGSSPVLDDRVFLTLIRARIVKNVWDGTMASIPALWATVFPDYILIIKDNQDMSIEMIVAGVETQLEQELIARGYTAPKPQGVRVNYSFPDSFVFGYDLNSSIIKGYDLGEWI